MKIKTVEDVKDAMIHQLRAIGFTKEENKVEILSDKLSNIYILISDNVEIFVCLNKEGDKNTFEIHSFVDGDNEVLKGVILYDEYTNLILAEKEQRGYIKNYVITTVNRILQSFENDNKE